MTLRITPQMVDTSNVTTLEADLNQLDTIQQTLSTGYQINQPSDNPYGETEALALNAQIASYASYQSNINDGTAWVESASASLQSIQSALNGVQTLTTQAANGTLNATDLKDSAQEVLQYIGEIKQMADAQYNGSYIFSGTATTTAPYQEGVSAPDTYQGNAGSIDRLIGPKITVPINANLHAVLGDGVPGDGGLLSTLRTIYNDMTGTGGGTQSDLGNQLTALQSNLSSLEVVQAQVGASQDQLQMAGTRIQSLQTTDQTQLGNIEDTNMAQATLQYSTEQAGYQAALQSTAAIVQQSLMNFLQGV
ncbi:flagellin [Conexibacter sp. DBS9H8]|uniref:flagellin N-terminal helical domain-containing protein n=1 Tax=Conexibacter sp. DBS9H8 TaxID=2937801 RepID=UPI00200FE595|nr:flagellin [Conexibacter sp. DBS9H8]